MEKMIWSDVLTSDVVHTRRKWWSYMLLANNWTTWSLEVIPTTGGPILTASPIFIKSFKKSTKAMLTTVRTKNTINTQPNNRGRDQIGEIDICIQQLLFRIGQYALMARKMHWLWLRRSLKCWLAASLKMSCARMRTLLARYEMRSWYSALGSCSATLSGCLRLDYPCSHSVGDRPL